MSTPIELQALDLLQKIAGYKTSDEILSNYDEDDHDGRWAAREEIVDTAADDMDYLITEARKILKAGE